jgi:hypothetical protein
VAGFLKMQPALLATGCVGAPFLLRFAQTRIYFCALGGLPQNVAETAKFFSSNGNRR